MLRQPRNLASSSTVRISSRPRPRPRRDSVIHKVLMNSRRHMIWPSAPPSIWPAGSRANTAKCAWSGAPSRASSKANSPRSRTATSEGFGLGSTPIRTVSRSGRIMASGGPSRSIFVDGGDTAFQFRDLALDASDLLVAIDALRLRLDIGLARMGDRLDRLAGLERDQAARGA